MTTEFPRTLLLPPTVAALRATDEAPPPTAEARGTGAWVMMTVGATGCVYGWMKS